MKLPAPKLGLVVHYGLVWAGAGSNMPPDAGKGRPCLIVDLEPVEEPVLPGRVITRVTYWIKSDTWYPFDDCSLSTRSGRSAPLTV